MKVITLVIKKEKTLSLQPQACLRSSSCKNYIQITILIALLLKFVIVFLTALTKLILPFVLTLNFVTFPSLLFLALSGPGAPAELFLFL